MARPLDDDVAIGAARVLDLGRQTWLNRSAARAFAAATSALLVATLVVSRSDQALGSAGTISASAVTSGTVALSDDDEDQTLFDLSDMAPGRPQVRCIEVTYEGTILPAELGLVASAPGPLARYLDMTIDQGTGGSFESCDGFRPDSTVFTGTLLELTERGWIGLGPFLNRYDARTYRVAFDLQDRSEAAGLATTVDLTWEVSP